MDRTRATIPANRRTFSRETWGLRFSSIHGSRPAVRMLWFYHAGGTASSLFRTISHLPQSWEIWVPEYPGRGGACSAAPPTTFLDLTARIAGQVQAFVDDVPVLLFGHSMGGLVAHEYLRALPTERHSQVLALVVSCTKAPANCVRRERVFTDRALLEHLTGLGQVPAFMLEDTAFIDATLGIMRRDYRLVDTYEPCQRDALRVPITVFAADADPVVPADQLLAWSRESCWPVGRRYFDGSHFYYAHSPHVFVAALQEVSGQVSNTCIREISDTA